MKLLQTTRTLPYKKISHDKSLFIIYLLIFEGFPNRVLVYPDRGGLQIMLMICTNKLCQFSELNPSHTANVRLKKLRDWCVGNEKNWNRGILLCDSGSVLKMITRSETSTNLSGSAMNRPGSAAQSGSEMNRSGSLRTYLSYASVGESHEHNDFLVRKCPKFHVNTSVPDSHENLEKPPKSHEKTSKKIR